MHEHETHLRSVMKSITFRVLATVTTILLVYIFTGQIDLAMKVGVVEVVAKIILYYGHERIWDFVSWGKVIVESE